MARKSARQIADEAVANTKVNVVQQPNSETFQLTETTVYNPPQQTQAPQASQFDFTKQPEARQIRTMNFDKLPLNLSVNLPDFQSLMSVSDVSNPSSFDAAGWKRVTEQQRALDKVHFAELNNYANNVADGITALISMASAAIKGAQLGQKMVQYATAREGIETELVGFKIQQSKTTQKRFDLDKNIMQEGFLAQFNITEGQILQVKLSDAKLTLQESQAKFQIRQAEVMALVGS